MTDTRIEAMAAAHMGITVEQFQQVGKLAREANLERMADAAEAYRAHPRTKLEAAVVDAAVALCSDRERMVLEGPFALRHIHRAVAALQAEREKQDG